MTNEITPEVVENEPAPVDFDGYTKRVTLSNGTEVLANVTAEAADSLTLDSELGSLTVQKANVIRIEPYADASLDALGTLKLRDQLGMQAVYVKSEPNVWRLVWNKPGESPSTILNDEYMSSAAKVSFEDLQSRYE